MVSPTRELDQLLSSVPAGAWVAISSDESHVVAYAEEMRDAVAKAKAAGEEHPVIARAPRSKMALIL